METLHPGLYIQEVKGTPPMEGVSTATGAFVGVTLKGEVNKPTLVTSWTEFVRNFGGLINESYLPYAVKGFFENGGTRAYIVRTVHVDSGSKTSDVAKLEIKDATDASIGFIKASSDGTWGDAIEAEIKDVSGTKFTLVVTDEKGVATEYKEVDLATAEEEFKAHATIRFDIVDETKTPKEVKAKLTGGNDGLTGLADADYVGDSAQGTGLYALDSVDVNLVSVAGVTTQAVHVGMITYCEGRKDCFAVLDMPMGLGITQVKDYKNDSNLASEFAGAYYPFLEVSDPIGVGKNPTKLIPPSGHVIGVIARIDNTRGVWKAPSGTEAKINGVLGVERAVTDAHQDILNPECINAIRAFDGAGVCVWGTRTLSTGEYKYIPVRRLIIFIESSTKKNLKWAIFEPNTEDGLWGKVRTALNAFLTGIWKDGGLKGAGAPEAFFVKCDGEVNTKDVIDAGRTYVDLGVAPVKPAEFIIFRISLR